MTTPVTGSTTAPSAPARRGQPLSDPSAAPLRETRSGPSPRYRCPGGGAKEMGQRERGVPNVATTSPPSPPPGGGPSPAPSPHSAPLAPSLKPPTMGATTRPSAPAHTPVAIDFSPLASPALTSFGFRSEKKSFSCGAARGAAAVSAPAGHRADENADASGALHGGEVGKEGRRGGRVDSVRTSILPRSSGPCSAAGSAAVCPAAADDDDDDGASCAGMVRSLPAGKIHLLGSTVRPSRLVQNGRGMWCG